MTCLFRVDTRIFQPNDTVLLNPVSYMNCIGVELEKIEKLLENERNSRGRNRAKSLFLFRDFCDAIKFSTKKNYYIIYSVKPTSIDGMFHGDMIIVEQMMRFKDNETIQSDLAKDYWNQKGTYKPCWEYLVDEAVAIERLADNFDNRLLNEFNEAGCVFERMNTYKSIIQKLML
jgi:DNA-binding transcriptional MerR regulator